MSNLRPATIAAREGVESDPNHGAVIPPLYLSSNFAFEGYDAPRTYDYSRSGNPTRSLLGDALTALEGGAGAVVTATGMAAATLVASLLGPDDLLVAPHDCYGGCYRLFTHLARKGAFRLEIVDLNCSERLEAALAQKPKLLWLETPSNPLLRLVDIEQLAHRAHRVGALVAVDNTFLSPILQQPLSLGADLVVHSTTKYINGHSDVVGGAVVARTRDLGEELTWWANCLGITGAPFDSYMTLRGLRTLPLRMSCHQANANAVSRLLSCHPAVAKVHYPGLPDHPQAELVRRQQAGPGAMLSFELRGGEASVRAFLEKLNLFSLAESLGGVESLVAHPATMTHASMEPQARRRAGISDSLLRLSVGIEDEADLCADLEQALVAAAQASFTAVNGRRAQAVPKGPKRARGLALKQHVL